MKFGIIIPAVLVALSGSALAQSQPATSFTPTVPTGKVRQVGFFTALNPDCTNNGDIDGRIVAQAQNGTVELEQGTGFAFYNEHNPRAACNNKSVQGIRVKYTSKDAYIGKDAFEVEFLTPNGSDVNWKYSVTVK